DIHLTLRDLEPGTEYTLYTYHHRWDENEDPITNVIVTGATNVTKPDIIPQTADIMDNPAKFVFTTGSGDVVITYQCLEKGQPFFNGFRLYGGSATVQFESKASSALELVISTKIPVVINDAQADKTYTVDYAVTGGSISGNDYRLASGKLTFAPGSKTQHISLSIIDDDIHEDNETIVIGLSNAKGPKVLLGTPTKHTYTIIDPRPKVLFVRASGSGMENVTPVHVPVTLSATTRKKVTVDYAVVGGTATAGVDYTLDSGTAVFEPGKTNQTIPVTIIADANDTEPIETIMIKLSNPTNALPGKHTVYTHTIVSQPIDLKIDLAVPTCDGKGLYPGLAKPGWTIWAAKAWRDMYMHDGVWLPSRKDPKAFAAGIEGTAIKAFLSTGSEGQLGIGAKGVCRHNLGGGGCPKGKASGDPIANSWAYAVDWAGPYAGDIILLLKDLPAGTYELYSYHNHWEPCKQKNRNCLDCVCGMPPMPSITANPLPGKPDKTPQDRADNILKRYRWNLPLGTGKGVTAIKNAYNVAPQHVLSDEELVPSVIKFSTDGSEVLIIYQADRSLPLYPDCARKGREGARGILNAFRLVLLEDPRQLKTGN
ncbi:MAG: Calx-beta domain-containing protein, partial [Planctomycetota bacterium]